MTQCPQPSVERNWPALCAALVAGGAGSRNNQAAALATVAIETASTFEPVREAFWLSEDWRKANLRYWPHYGRGYIQLTWESNYQAAGNAIGIPNLKDTPDRVMEPLLSAKVFAWYWTVARPGIPGWSDARNWREVRKAVQGADAGLDRLVAICNALLA